jgi:hypothetical protein
VTAADGTLVGTTKIVDHGSPAQCWNLVILGDGYQASELHIYAAQVDVIVNYMQAAVPFGDYWPAINVFRVDVASTDSGADDPLTCADGTWGSGATPATYFDSSLCANGATRRHLTGDTNAALAIAASQVPQVHARLVLVNAALFGGATSRAGATDAVGWVATGWAITWGSRCTNLAMRPLVSVTSTRVTLTPITRASRAFPM